MGVDEHTRTAVPLARWHSAAAAAASVRLIISVGCWCDGSVIFAVSVVVVVGGLVVGCTHAPLLWVTLSLSLSAFYYYI